MAAKRGTLARVGEVAKGLATTVGNAAEKHVVKPVGKALGLAGDKAKAGTKKATTATTKATKPAVKAVTKVTKPATKATTKVATKTTTVVKKAASKVTGGAKKSSAKKGK